MADRTAPFIALLATALLFGCQDLPVTDPTLCDQSSEFGSGGCVEVTGQVVGASGQPLMNVYVGAGPGADGNLFDDDYQPTDANGRFDIRFHRIVSLPGGPTDSVSLWIRAAVVPVPPQMASTVKDSVLLRLHVTPIGSRPEPVEVKIALPTP